MEAVCGGRSGALSLLDFGSDRTMRGIFRRGPPSVGGILRSFAPSACRSARIKMKVSHP